MTSWMEEGMQQEGFSLVIRQLARKLGELPASALNAIKTLNLFPFGGVG